MRRKIVAGNWKMCGTRASVKDLLIGLKEGFPNNALAEVIVFPSFVFLDQAQALLKDSALSWGAQQVSEHDSGAFTGEISTTMLKDFGCQYVLIGHSERRAYYHEDNAVLTQKLQAVYQSGMTPMLCVGETQQQRDERQTESVIAEQLSILWAPHNLPFLDKVVVAYEPVWAIGTGKTASPEDAQAVHAFIRTTISVQDKNVAKNVSLLYGGSVKADNAAALFSMPDIDGGLVGGASLNSQDFLAIIAAAM